MRNTLVPAQITTVEDKITANLNLKQILIIICLIFIDLFIFGIFPPFFKLYLYKDIILFILDSNLLLLAIRIKGILMIDYLILVIKYYIRPGYYFFSTKANQKKDNSNDNKKYSNSIKERQLSRKKLDLKKDINNTIDLTSKIDGMNFKVKRGALYAIKD